MQNNTLVRILVVGGLESERETYKNLLTKKYPRCYEFIFTDSGIDAIGLCKNKQIHCVLVDFCLFDMDAVELIKKLYSNFGNNILLLAILDRDTAAIVDKCKKGGAHNVIIKSKITADYMNDLIRSEIAKPRTETVSQQTNIAETFPADLAAEEELSDDDLLQFDDLFGEEVETVTENAELTMTNTLSELEGTDDDSSLVVENTIEVYEGDELVINNIGVMNENLVDNNLVVTDTLLVDINHEITNQEVDVIFDFQDLEDDNVMNFVGQNEQAAEQLRCVNSYDTNNITTESTTVPAENQPETIAKQSQPNVITFSDFLHKPAKREVNTSIDEQSVTMETVASKINMVEESNTKVESTQDSLPVNDNRKSEVKTTSNLVFTIPCYTENSNQYSICSNHYSSSNNAYTNWSSVIVNHVHETINDTAYNPVTNSLKDNKNLSTEANKIEDDHQIAVLKTNMIKISNSTNMFAWGIPNTEMTCKNDKQMPYSQDYQYDEQKVFYYDNFDSKADSSSTSRDMFDEDALIVDELKIAFSRNEFYLVFQPIFNLGGQEILGYEALVRWEHPRYDIIGPKEFIPLAEHSGLMVPIGEWIVREACMNFVRWQQANKNFNNGYVVIKISLFQLYDEEFIKKIADIIATTGIDPSRIMLEFKEECLLIQPTHTLDLFERLRDMKINICLEEFGVGYSTLKYFFDNYANTLKIAPAVIRQVCNNKKALMILKSILAVAKEMNVNVIAAEIESEAQLKLLQGLGCNFGQGYFLCRPMTVAMVEDSMRYFDSNDNSENIA